MPYDVFISYCTADPQPPEIAEFLERNGVKCWIAPRNIAPGTPYARAIIDGIEEAQVVLVFISSASILSEDVLNEIDNAHRMKKTIIPVFIEDIPLSNEFGYYLNRNQWIKMYDDSIHQKEYLLSTLRNMLEKAPLAHGSDSSTKEGANKYNGTSFESSQSEDGENGFSFKAIYKNKGCMVMVTMCVVAIIMIPVFFSVTSNSDSSSVAETPYLAENEYSPSFDSDDMEAQMPHGKPTEINGRIKPINKEKVNDETVAQPQNEENPVDMDYEGTLSLEYGSWQGGVRNGKPHGKGCLTFYYAHKVDSSSSYEANPGDYFIATYENGMLVSGKLYDEDGTFLAAFKP